MKAALKCFPCLDVWYPNLSTRARQQIEGLRTNVNKILIYFIFPADHFALSIENILNSTKSNESVAFRLGLR